MVKTEASKPIPERWELVRSEQKDGKTSCCYICQATGQHFYSYERLARYVKYAKAAEVSIYAQDFNADDFKRKSGRFKGQLPLVGEHSSAVCQEPAAVEKSPEEEMTILLGVTDSAEGCSAGEVPASVGEPAQNGLEEKLATNLEGTGKGKVILQYFRRRFKGKEKLEKMQVQDTN
ncbi:hypothetical protein K2173_013316 [Erythroxylum novogranatense]|uniref:MBD domain-containing protein n=1 Tax=Erythroxylum novogranatense TaxID=1862640 RepID=A0AAV8SA17_9ROSI|nr:hypothetical protein K2173_013316 [Erythroxylum novogranatense]